MAIRDVKRVVIGFLESERPQVVAELKKLGTVHIDDMFSLLEAEQLEAEQAGEEDSQGAKDGAKGQVTSEFRQLNGGRESEKLEKHLDLLSKAAQNLGPYLQKPSFAVDLLEGVVFGTFNIHPLISPKEYHGTLEKRTDLLDRAQKVNEASRKLVELETEIRKFKDQKNLFTRYLHILFPLELLGDTKKTRTRYGSISLAKYDLMVDTLSLENRNFYEQKVLQKKNSMEFVITYLLEEAEDLESRLEDFGFIEPLLPEGSKTPSEEVEILQVIIEEKRKDFEELKDTLKNEAKYHLAFLALYDFFSNRKSEFDVCENFAGTEKTVFLSGWILTDKVEHTVKVLEEVSSSVDFQLSNPVKGERAPAQLRSESSVVNSFNFITRMYGSPKQGDLDPTPFFWPFFVVFLGVCLSDAGYGLILLFLSLYGLKVLHKGKNFLKVLAMGSGATIVVGIFLGSWFGADLDADISWMPSFASNFRDLLRSLRVINLAGGSGIINFFILALVLGIIQVFAGLGVKFYWNIKNGKPKDAVFDQVFWMLFLLGFLGFIMDFLGGYGGLVTIGSQILLVIGAILLVLTQGRQKEGLVGKIFTGLLSLYGLTGYFSDVLSYSRLLALGLATGLIAMIVNTLGLLLYTGIAGIHPIVGPIIAIVILIPFLIFAHMANIALSLLGAFIHSLRLQYIEYFSKFYEGGGRAFKPFREEFNKVDLVVAPV